MRLYLQNFQLRRLFPEPINFVNRGPIVFKYLFFCIESNLLYLIKKLQKYNIYTLLLYCNIKALKHKVTFQEVFFSKSRMSLSLLSKYSVIYRVLCPVGKFVLWEIFFSLMFNLCNLYVCIIFLIDLYIYNITTQLF